MVERADRVLPVSQQCRLLAVSRSAVYRKPAEVSKRRAECNPPFSRVCRPVRC